MIVIPVKLKTVWGGGIANAVDMHLLFSWELSTFVLGRCVIRTLQIEVLKGEQIMQLRVSDASGHLPYRVEQSVQGPPLSLGELSVL